MKALSLYQPWASLVACGAKRYETRSWGTRYRGPLAIHAAKKVAAFDHPLFATAVSLGLRPPFILGAIVAYVDLTDCIRLEVGHIRLPFWMKHETLIGDFSVGRFAWRLENLRLPPQPIPCCGRQGLFRVPEII